MARIFYPQRFLVANEGRAQEARDIVYKLVDEIDAIGAWSNTSQDFVNEMIEKFAVSTNDVVVTEKQLAWLKKLHVNFVEKKEERLF